MSPKSSPKDFSLFSLFTAGLACFAGVAHAYTQPVGPEPEGNPIALPGLNSIVPVDKPYAITWKPTTSGTVTLVLLKGPANNLAVVGPIAEKIQNDGSYTWTPADDLAPGNTGYGIQLIVDATGQYQYTTQFGISNPGYKAASESSSSAAPASSAASSGNAASTSCSTSTASHAAVTAYPVSSAAASASASGYPVANSSVITPTVPMSVPSSLRTSAAATAYPTGSNSTSTSPSSAPQHNGASGLAASFGGLVIAAGVAVFAL